MGEHEDVSISFKDRRREMSLTLKEVENATSIRTITCSPLKKDISLN